MLKHLKKLLLAAVGIVMVANLTGCDNVPTGQVGVRVNKYGDDRGVQTETMKPGRYWAAWNTDVFLFPTFYQNHVWTKEPTEGSPNDDSFTFQTDGGMAVNADIGIQFFISEADAPKVFTKYRKGVDEVRDVVLRNIVRDALNVVGSTMSVEDVYGKGKAKLQNDVLARVQKQASQDGITVNEVYFVGEMRLPQAVKDSINAKMKATQDAMRIENEVRSTEAEAQKTVAEAKGQAESIAIKGKALRENPQILEQYKLETERMIAQKWNGAQPSVVGGSGGMILQVPQPK